MDLREIRSAKMVEVAHSVISGVFSEAIDSARVQVNPAQGLLKPILPSKKRRVLSKPDPLSKSELRTVLDSARKVLNPDRAVAIEVMVKTGMRVGECLAMHVDNLDTRNRLDWIKEKVRHGKWGLPKAGEDRKVDLSEELMLQLQVHLRRLKERMLAEGKPVGHMFPGLTERMMQAAIRRACQNARIRVRTPHEGGGNRSRELNRLLKLNRDTILKRPYEISVRESTPAHWIKSYRSRMERLIVF